MNGLDLLGCDDEVGGLYDGIFQAAGGLMQGAANAEQQDEADDKKRADQEKILNIAIAADLAATTAAAAADISAQFHTKTASSDASAAAAKSDAQDAAGKGLDDAGVQKRIAAATTASADAKKVSAAKPKDAYSAALAKAWATTLSKIQGGSGDGKGGASQESWFTRPVLGKFSGTTVLIGAGILGVVGLVIRKKLSRGGKT